MPREAYAAKIERFWSRVHKSDGCWTWSGQRDIYGYGVMSFNGKSTKAHRIAWLLEHGHMPPSNLLVRHSCDTPACVNPAHLLLGTNSDNMRDMVERGRSLTGDKNPSRVHKDRMPRGEKHTSAKLTAEQVIAIRAMYIKAKSLKKVAAHFGIAFSNVANIVKRRTWKEIPA